MKEKGKSILLIYLAAMFLVSAAAVNVQALVTPKVYVDPAVKIDATRVPGTDFTVTVRVADVTEMWAYRVDLAWGAPILDAADPTEGSFLKAGGSTAFVWLKDQATGTLSVTCTLVGGTHQTGNGILFSVKFTVEQLGATVLDIYYSNVLVKGPPPMYLPTPADHTSEDGFFSNIVGANYDVAVTSVAKSKTIVCQKYSADVNVTVQNQGSINLGFGVNAYYDSTRFAYRVPVLSPGAPTTLTFKLDATDIDKGVYTISASVSIIPGETDTADNSKIDGTIRVNMVGDMTSDGKVTITDIVIIALAFGSKPGDPNWNANADITNDKKVTITDIVIAALNFGQTDP